MFGWIVRLISNLLSFFLGLSLIPGRQRINLEKHPRFVSTPSSSNTSTLMEEIFDALVAQNLVVYPGRQFTIESPGYEVPFFRLTFAGEREETEKGIEIFGRVVRTFFEEGPEGEVSV